MADKQISAKGEFVYPHLNKPDVRFNEAGEYKLTLKVPQKEALSMVTLLDKELDACIAKVEKEKKGKKVKQAPKPYKIEDGFAFFKFKMKATGVNRKTKESFSQKPALFDSNKNPFPQSTSIWGGSKGKVAFNVKDYFVPALGAGITLQLIAVQIIDLVEGGGKQGDLFDKEDGYTVQETDVSSEVQTSTDF
nr:single-stranded DNA-binding protein [uncultured Mediterranean phage uvMED]